MNFEKNEMMENIADQLIKVMPNLQCIRECGPKIAYLMCDYPKTKNGGSVYGDCEKVKPKMREFMDYDYVITAYEPNVADLTANQWKLLMYHELLHILCYEDEHGEMVYKIRPHDLQDFRCITDKYGVDWVTDENVGDVMESEEE